MLTAAAIRKLAEFGLDALQIAEVAEAMADAPRPVVVDEAAERRRAADRERKRRERDMSADIPRNSADTPSLSQDKERSPPEPPSKENSTLTLPAPREARATDDGFERFWQAYPRRVGKLAARKAYAVAVRKVSGPDPPGLLIEAVERAKPFWTDPRFIPHPATWLNQGRWDDEPEPARTPRQANLDRAFRAAQSLLGERGP